MAIETVHYHVNRGQQPTAMQIAEIEAASKLPVVYDEENPEIDPDETPALYAAAMQAVAERNRRLAERMKTSA